MEAFHTRTIVLSVLLVACDARAAAPHATPPTCPRSIDGFGDLVAPGATLFLGERHGTAELPAFLADLAWAASQSGPTTVALEIPLDEQARVDDFLASAGETPIARHCSRAGSGTAHSRTGVRARR